jgi:hypothetical protein
MIIYRIRAFLGLRGLPRASADSGGNEVVGVSRMNEATFAGWRRLFGRYGGWDGRTVYYIRRAGRDETTTMVSSGPTIPPKQTIKF